MKDIKILVATHKKYQMPKSEIYLPVQVGAEGKEKIEGRKFDLEFHWIPLEELKNMKVYPTNVVELMNRINDGVQHFIYQE